MTTRKTSAPFDLGGFLLDLLIDLALIALGLALYYQFEVRAIFPVTLSPAITDMVGGRQIAVYLICGIPFVIGLYSLIRTLARALARLRGR